MKFIRSEKSTEELEEQGLTVPFPEDIKAIPHDQYLKGIQDKESVLICMDEPTPEFPDNLQGECDTCGCDIYYRPYNEKAHKKICVRCADKLIEEEKADKK